LSGTEVSFVSRYRDTMLMVRQSGCAEHDSGLDNQSEPSIKDLARHLAAESSSNAADIVDRFLSSTRLPSFDTIPSGGRVKLPIDSCHLAGLVTFDLAICSQAMPEVSRELLRIARGKLNSSGTKHCPQTCTNLKSFVEDMIKMLSEVTTGQSVSDLLCHDSLASLLVSVLPLEADGYRVAVDGIVWIEKAVSQTCDVLKQHSLHPAANCPCSCTPDELLPQLVDVCHSALPCGSLLPVLQRFVFTYPIFVLGESCSVPEGRASVSIYRQFFVFFVVNWMRNCLLLNGITYAQWDVLV